MIWRNGLPEGIIHWTGWAKPWYSTSAAWRSDIWAAEETTWDELRNGCWEKPAVCMVESPQGSKSAALARRGWRVDFFPMKADCEAISPLPLEIQDSCALSITDENIFSDVSNAGEPIESVRGGQPPLLFPDLFVHSITTVSTSMESIHVKILARAELVGFGADINPVPLLEKLPHLPASIMIQGPLPAATIQGLQKLGYGHEARIKREDWPDGGPAPSLLEFTQIKDTTKIGAAEDLYLKR